MCLFLFQLASGSREGVRAEAQGSQAGVQVPHQQRVELRQDERKHQALQQRSVEVLRMEGQLFNAELATLTQSGLGKILEKPHVIRL